VSYSESVPETVTDAPLDTEVRIAAMPERLSVVRAVAADIAMREDFDLDAIADLRMAVDEACSTLVTLAAPGAVLRCRFRSQDGEVQVRATVACARSVTPTHDSFGWRVLTVLADSATTWTSAADGSDPETHLVHIDLVKRKAQVTSG
jgi:serine/threonine-protein kinase RsbW